MARAKKIATEPTVVVGSHLTVTTYPNGRTELKWDDEALRRDVLEALASVNKTPVVKSKKASTEKVVAKKKTTKKAVK
jgi:hypothetical protein